MVTNKFAMQNWNSEGDWDPCSYYQHRLDWLEKRVSQRIKAGEDIPEAQVDKWWLEEHRRWENNEKDLHKIRLIQKNCAILVPSHYYQSRWLRTCLDSCTATGFFTLLAYDNPFYDKSQSLVTRLPSPMTLMAADSVVMKHKSWGSGVGVPHAWNVWYGLRLLKGMGFEYVFNINGDCIMEHPEGIFEIFQLLDGYDLIACEYREKYCGTMSWLSSIDLALELWDHYMERLYAYPLGTAEGRMGKYVEENGYKVFPVENPEDPHFKPPGIKGTWRKVLGFRHLHAEHKVRRSEKMEPIERHYFDFGKDGVFMNGHEKETLLKYYDTGDRKHLEAWWS